MILCKKVTEGITEILNTNPILQFQWTQESSLRDVLQLWLVLFLLKTLLCLPYVCFADDSLGADAYWAAGLHLYTPLPFRPGRGGLGDRIKTHFFFNAGNLASLDTSTIWGLTIFVLMSSAFSFKSIYYFLDFLRLKSSFACCQRCSLSNYNQTFFRALRSASVQIPFWWRSPIQIMPDWLLLSFELFARKH